MAANYRIKPEKGKKGDNSLAPRQFLLVASTVQMTVLLFFNNKDKSTVKELSRAVGSDLEIGFKYILLAFSKLLKLLFENR